jgi:U4/U6.U5 tri-snRNP-associated protein 1
VDEDEGMESEDEDDTLAEMAAREGLSLEEYRLKIEREMNEMANIKAEDQVSCHYRSTGTGADKQVEEEEEVAANTGGGVVSFLNLLRQQGSLKTTNPEDAEREATQRANDLWKADFRRRAAMREVEKLRARGQPMDDAQREYEKRRREQQEIRDAAELYKSYKPSVEIKYHDEFGRGKLIYLCMRCELMIEMTPKEAWRSLSHKFHGKTSGRMKTEKRLKKIAEERNQLKMNSGDTPTGMTSAFARRQEKTGEAHMVLSVGNKGSVQPGQSKPRIRR